MTRSLTIRNIVNRLALAGQSGYSFTTDPGRVDDPNPANDRLTCAAVLMPLIWNEKEWHMVFTRRTNTVESHKGQVSFPGGTCLKNETPEQTALREAEEEIGLRAADVRILGHMHVQATITAFLVTPVVGLIPWPYALHPSPSEVERIFTIPLKWLASRNNWREKEYSLPEGGHVFPVIIYQPYDAEILWGASARITHEFLRVVDLM